MLAWFLRFPRLLLLLPLLPLLLLPPLLVVYPLWQRGVISCWWGTTPVVATGQGVEGGHLLTAVARRQSGRWWGLSAISSKRAASHMAVVVAASGSTASCVNTFCINGCLLSSLPKALRLEQWRCEPMTGALLQLH
jgi:hypothetical protein